MRDALSRDEAAQLLERLSASAAARNRRARVARAIGAVVATAVLVTTLVVTVGALAPLGDETRAADDDVPSAIDVTPTDDSGYAISTTLSETRTDQAVVDVEIAWAGETFPGVRTCDVIVLDREGAEVGRSSVPTVVLEPDRTQRFRIEVQVADEASSAEGICGPRLDVGEPYAYAFHEPSLRDGRAEGIGFGAQVTWAGNGTPGVLRCRIAALAPDGTVVAHATTLGPDTLLLRTSSLSELGAPLDVDLELRDRSHPFDIVDLYTDIACVPYVDGNEPFPPLPQQIPQPVRFPYESATGEGYLFRDVVFEPEAGTWTIRYSVEWEDPRAYPGVRECTLRAWRADGSLVGEMTHQIDNMPRHIDETWSVAEEPVGFEARCGPRLDTPVAYLISEERVVESGDRREGAVYDVVFQVEWPDGVTLPAYPGHNDCIATIRDADGAKVAEAPFGLGTPPGQVRHTVWADSVVTSETPPARTLVADVRCVPWNG